MVSLHDFYLMPRCCSVDCCLVDYALKGSTFSLSKCDFSRMFHTERSWLTYLVTVVIVSGRPDLPSDANAFALTSFVACERQKRRWARRNVCRSQAISFEAWSSLLGLNKGSSFLHSAFCIWIAKRFSLVRECYVFLQRCITLGPAR